MEYNIRPYRAEDFDELVPLWHNAKRDAQRDARTQQSYVLDDDRGYFQDVILVECDVWVAEVQERIAGFLAINGDRIHQLFVRVDLQEHGLDAALLKKAMELSPSGLCLYTFQKDAQARQFYEKHGFTAISFGFSPPPENEPDVEYYWQPADAKR